MENFFYNETSYNNMIKYVAIAGDKIKDEYNYVMDAYSDNFKDYEMEYVFDEDYNEVCIVSCRGKKLFQIDVLDGIEEGTVYVLDLNDGCNELVDESINEIYTNRFKRDIVLMEDFINYRIAMVIDKMDEYIRLSELRYEVDGKLYETFKENDDTLIFNVTNDKAPLNIYSIQIGARVFRYTVDDEYDIKYMISDINYLINVNRGLVEEEII